MTVGTNEIDTSAQPCESGALSCVQNLRYFAESLIKSMREGHIRVVCDPGYPFEPVRLLHFADNIECKITTGSKRDVNESGDCNERSFTANEMREALLAPWGDIDHKMVHDMIFYAAAVVERCEEIKSRYCLARNRIDKITTFHPDATYVEILSKIKEFDYILKGTTNG